MKLKKTKTDRGFAQVEFVDLYGSACSLQKSSLATQDAVWFGPLCAELKILSTDAAKLGRKDLLKPAGPEQLTGWVPFPIPGEVSWVTRAHLTRDMVKKLLPYLIRFAETGEL